MSKPSEKPANGVKPSQKPAKQPTQIRESVQPKQIPQVPTPTKQPTTTQKKK